MNFEPKKYQIVIFGNYQDIKPDPNIIQSLFPLLIVHSLIPSVTNNEFDISKNKIIHSLKFATVDNHLVVVFRDNGIHIEMLSTSSNNLSSLEDFIKKVNIILGEINSVFPRQANRMSLVTVYVDDSISSTNKDELYKKIFNPLDDVNEKLPYEWSHRAVSRVDRMIGKTREIFNNVITLSRGYNQFSEMTMFTQQVKRNRIELIIDINTIPESRLLRFNLKDYGEFFADASVKTNEILVRTIKKLDYNG